MTNSLNPLFLSNKISIVHLYSAYTQTYPTNFKFSGERHNFWELDFVLDGMVGITCEDKIYKCLKGDMVLHPPNHFHTCWSMKKSQPTLFTISFSVDSPLLLPSLKIHSTIMEQKIISNLMQRVNILFKKTNGYFFYNQEKYNLPDYHCLDSAEYQITKAYLEILVLHLSQNKYISYDIHEKNKDAKKYAAIVSYLKNNINKNLTIPEIAKDLLESTSNLKRIFQKFSNCGIMQYYNDLRLKKSIYYLEQGLSIAAITKKMNFSSQNYFSFFFKKNTGVCPSKYISSSIKEKS